MEKEYLIFTECKQFLPEPVAIFLGPFVREEFLNRIPTLEELISVAPH